MTIITRPEPWTEEQKEAAYYGLYDWAVRANEYLEQRDREKAEKEAEETCAA